MKKTQDSKLIDSFDFLSDELFLYWKLNPSIELDEYWNRFLEKNPHLESEFKKAIIKFDTLQRDLPDFELSKQSVKARLAASVHTRRLRKRNFYIISSVAASLLLFIVSLLYVNNQNSYQSQYSQEIIIGNKVNDNEVKLQLGGEELNLSNNARLDFSGSDQNIMVEDSAGQKKLNTKKQDINKLTVPFGKRSTLILADGTNVWLNSGSEIEFPTHFNGEKRIIKMKGEIYLDVAKSEKIFEVNTPKSQVNVHGTSFNVKAYNDESKEYIVLVEGSVEVKTPTKNLMLKPGRMAEIEGNQIKNKKVDVAEYISWKNGYFLFDKEPLEEVLLKIGRYYNVDFRYTDDLKLWQRTCSGKLHLSENINNVMKAFSGMTELTYTESSQNTFIISK